MKVFLLIGSLLFSVIVQAQECYQVGINFAPNIFFSYGNVELQMKRIDFTGSSGRNSSIGPAVTVGFNPGANVNVSRRNVTYALNSFYVKAGAEFRNYYLDGSEDFFHLRDRLFFQVMLGYSVNDLQYKVKIPGDFHPDFRENFSEQASFMLFDMNAGKDFNIDERLIFSLIAGISSAFKTSTHGDFPVFGIGGYGAPWIQLPDMQYYGNFKLQLVFSYRFN